MIAEYEQNAKNKQKATNKPDPKKKVLEIKPKKEPHSNFQSQAAAQNDNEKSKSIISQNDNEKSKSVISQNDNEKNKSLVSQNDNEKNKSTLFDENKGPERIIGATDKDGELKFLFKWKDSDEPTLVSANIANKHFSDIVIRFYEQRISWDFTDTVESVNVQDIKNAFDNGYEPNSIIGATNFSGHLMFLMDWKGGVESDLVFSKIAKEKCPELVIKFYQEQLILEDINTDNEN